MQPETRQKIIDSFMDLLGETAWESVTFERLAGRAGVPLSALRGAYDTRVDIIADYARRIDEGILDSTDPDMAKEGPRERLFDLLFSRLEALSRHKRAIANLGRAARRDPGLALALSRIAAISMSWMLTAAGIRATGAQGMLRAQGLALVWSRVLRTWLHEDDPGLPQTMAQLDSQLRRAERAALRLERLRRFVGGARGYPPETSPLAGSDLAEGHPS